MLVACGSAVDQAQFEPTASPNGSSSCPNHLRHIDAYDVRNPSLPIYIEVCDQNDLWEALFAICSEIVVNTCQENTGLSLCTPKFGPYTIGWPEYVDLIKPPASEGRQILVYDASQCRAE